MTNEGFYFLFFIKWIKIQDVGKKKKGQNIILVSIFYI